MSVITDHYDDGVRYHRADGEALRIGDRVPSPPLAVLITPHHEERGAWWVELVGIPHARQVSRCWAGETANDAQTRAIARLLREHAHDVASRVRAIGGVSLTLAGGR